MVCYDPSHGHEPGNCEFQQDRHVTNLIQRLRERYPRLFIEIYWGLKEAGPWSLRGLNSLEPLRECLASSPGMTPADDLRLPALVQHNYRSSRPI